MTRPFRPAEPSSVQTINSSQTAANLSCQKIRSRLRNPMTPIDMGATLLVGPGLRKHRRHAQAAADAHDLLRMADVARHAHRPDQGEQRLPTWQSRCIACVVLPTAWMTSVIGALVAIEVGQRQRNPLTMLVRHHDDELPGRAARAIIGCSISSR